MPHRTPAAAAALAVLLSVAALFASSGRDARGCGTIYADGATLATGAAPSRGTITLDPCAGAISYAVPGAPLGPLLGTIQFPAAPVVDPGNGTGSFFAAADVQLPGGTYEFTTYTVPAGVQVTYTGAVTLRVTGRVDVFGTIATAGDDASVAIDCAGDVLFLSPDDRPDGVHLPGQDSSLTIRSATTIFFVGVDGSDGTPRQASEKAGAVLGHGAIVLAARTVSLTDARFLTPSKNIHVEAGESLRVVRTSLQSDGAAVLLSCAAGAVTLEDAVVHASNGVVDVRAATVADLLGSTVTAGGGAASVASAEGTVRLGSTRVEGSDGVRVRSALDLELFEGAVVAATGSGDAELWSAEAVRVLGTGGPEEPSRVTAAGAGRVSLLAKDVRIDGTVATSGGDVRIHAANTVKLEPSSDVEAAAPGNADVRGGGDVTVRGRLAGGSVAVSSVHEVDVPVPDGATRRELRGGLLDVLDASVRGTAGDVALAGLDTVRLSGSTFDAAGRFSAASLRADLLARDATVRTDDGTGGAIRLAAVTGLDVTDATLTTGAHPAASGPIDVLLFTGRPDAVVETAWPQTLRVRDGGSVDPPSLHFALSLRIVTSRVLVGGTVVRLEFGEYAIEGVAQVEDGRVVVRDDDGQEFGFACPSEQYLAPGPGERVCFPCPSFDSMCRAATVDVSGDFYVYRLPSKTRAAPGAPAAVVALDALAALDEIPVVLTIDGFEHRATIAPRRTRRGLEFDLRRDAAGLRAPHVRVEKLVERRRGGGRDALDLVLGVPDVAAHGGRIAADGKVGRVRLVSGAGRSRTVGDVRLAYDGLADTSLADGALRVKGQRIVRDGKRAPPELRAFVLDPRRGAVAVRLRNLDLGARTGPVVEVRIELVLDDRSYALTVPVRPGRRGTYVY